jgi:hypothetical protein
LSSNRRVETLKEALCRVLKNSVDWSLYIQLGILDGGRAQSEDRRARVRIDIAISVEISRFVDLSVSEVCQRGRSIALRRSVSVSVEDVNAENGLLCIKKRHKRGEEEKLFGKHHGVRVINCRLKEFEARLTEEKLDGKATTSGS